MNGFDNITISDPQSGKSVSLTPDDLKNATNALEEVVNEVPKAIEEKFILAPAVEVVANHLISTVERFGHLAEARIVYLFRTGDWLSKGRWVMGRAYVNDERQRFLSNIDLQVVVSQRVWDMADEAQREALLAHELCHFESMDPDKHGNPRWRRADHDLEEFAYVVRKYGIWDESLRQFMEAYNEGQAERNQVRMFPERDDEASEWAESELKKREDEAKYGISEGDESA